MDKKSMKTLVIGCLLLIVACVAGLFIISLLKIDDSLANTLSKIWIGVSVIGGILLTAFKCVSNDNHKNNGDD